MSSPQAGSGACSEYFRFRVQGISKGDFRLGVIKDLVVDVPVTGVVQPLLECGDPSFREERISRVLDELEEHLV
jgi:hypothetical protein